MLNKNWKETHHDRLCEVLEKVENECKVEISFVKGAYQFRGTLESLSNVLQCLRSESDSNQVFSSAQQDGELANGKDHGPFESCARETVVSDIVPGREIATSDKDLRISSKKDPAVNHETEPETEQMPVEQEETLPVTTSADLRTSSKKDPAVNHETEPETEQMPVEQEETLPVITSADPRTSGKEDPAVNHETKPETEQMPVEQEETLLVTTSAAHVINSQPNASISDASRVTKCDSADPFTEAAPGEYCPDDSKSLDQHYDKNALPQTNPSMSLPCVEEEKSFQANGDFLASDKNTGTKTESTSTPKHEQKGVEASSHGASDLPEPNTSYHVLDASDSGKDNEQESTRELQTGQKDVGLTDARNLSDSSADQGSEASKPSIPPCQSVAASADNESAHDPQHCTGTAVQDSSTTAASASSEDVKNKNMEELKASRKVLMYERPKDCEPSTSS